TEELKNMPDLQAVILQMFIMTIASQIFMGDRSKRCLICIDEAWDLLKSPQMEGFIESLARRLRKYNGALLIGTQDPSDFERSPGAEAARQNSNWLITLGKSSDAINTLKKKGIIPMDAYKEMALSSLHMEGGKYSELAIYNKSSGAFFVLQLKLEPFTAMLTSTKADEFEAVKELQKQGLNLVEAIEWLINHKKAFKENIQQGKGVKDAIASILKNNMNHLSTKLTSTQADEFRMIEELQKQGLTLLEAIQWLVNHKESFKENMQQGKRIADAITSTLKSMDHHAHS
ncbi:MAG: hypothetical protein HKM07_04825, partial [Chlamydiae bacterium]|nr:hypothetical protein [Chlamydiota bacterium]